MASVKVAVRVRPFNNRELQLDSGCTVSVHGNQVVLHPLDRHAEGHPPPGRAGSAHAAISERLRQHKFTFDFSYWSHDAKDAHFVNQERVFTDLGTDVVENAFSGYNACVFAYGQTGSGKTYTMMGTEEERGLIPRICKTMFDKMEAGKQEEGTTYRTEVSYLEIYNEKVKDLLSKKRAGDHNLKVREHPQTGPYVENLSKHLVVDYNEILRLMEQGNNVRTTAATNMNDTSSRSHAIFTITFVNAGFTAGLPHETVSKIHLVDLAGSERADSTGATGQRLKEGAHINKSLVTLGSVISALAEASSSNSKATKSSFIPYRDSVLTWLLKDSLGGNSKTIMIATISPAEVNHSETLSTLRYANRAKNIINKPTVNEDPNVTLIRELRDEIERLRNMMSIDPMQLSTMQREIALKEEQERHLTEEWTEKWKEAANILKEQEALALKRTGLGVILDSDKPHLVGIDEDVLSTGITLYTLKEGITTIGGYGCDILLRGPSIEDKHCQIAIDESGTATLTTSTDGALCMVNAALVEESVKLSQGCVVVLGKTNMFRYNDPSEAASMRKLNETENLLNITSDSRAAGSAGCEEAAAARRPYRKESSAVNPLNLSLSQSHLLSQSLSDLRSSTPNKASLSKQLKQNNKQPTGGEGGIEEAETEVNRSDLSVELSRIHREDEDRNNNNDESNRLKSGLENLHQREESATSRDERAKNFFGDDEDLTSSKCSAASVLSSEAGSSNPAASMTTPEEMNELYRGFCEQRSVVLGCLDNDACDVDTLNKQASLLKGMRDNYLKRDYEFTRNLWINAHSGRSPYSSGNVSGEMNEDTLRSLDEHFSSLVEMEVDRRLFQERVLKAESEYHERELLILQKERELDEVRRKHEHEIYVLRKKLSEANSVATRTPANASTLAAADQGKNTRQAPSPAANAPLTHCQIKIVIPRFTYSGSGSSGNHAEYEVCIHAIDAEWSVRRRFRRFRDLHMALSHQLGVTVSALNFPSRRLFGSASESVCLERQRQLQTYLNSVVQRCHLTPKNALYNDPGTRSALLSLSTFFEPDTAE